MHRATPKRVLSNIDDLTTVPPASPLPSSQTLGRISRAQGKNLFNGVLPSGESVLVELAPIFRGKVWLRRGGYVLIDTATLGERVNKIVGEIVNVVRNERAWRKMDYWPKEFAQKEPVADEESTEESTIGKIPPNSDDEDSIDKLNK